MWNIWFGNSFLRSELEYLLLVLTTTNSDPETQIDLLKL